MSTEFDAIKRAISELNAERTCTWEHHIAKKIQKSEMETCRLLAAAYEAGVVTKRTGKSDSGKTVEVWCLVSVL